jgi:hypothetical protein
MTATVHALSVNVVVLNVRLDALPEVAVVDTSMGAV